MRAGVRKALRTAQNFFPWLAEAKNDAYHLARRYLGTVHDGDFRVVQLLPRSADDLFVDVGANRGQSILAIRRYRGDARIVSFEPNPVIFNRLQRRFGTVAGVRLVNVGLGEAAADLPLYVPSYRGFVYDGIASFSRHSATTYFCPRTLHFYDPKRVTIAEHVCQIRTLDSFDLAPSFLKIDIEGYEYEALLGGQETLRRHEPVLLIERYYGDSRVAELLSSMDYAEIVERDGRLVPGTSTGLNMLLATPRRV